LKIFRKLNVEKKKCPGCQPGKSGRGFMVHYKLEITIEAVEIFTTLSIIVQS
jgi:hypothetical protein